MTQALTKVFSIFLLILGAMGLMAVVRPMTEALKTVEVNPPIREDLPELADVVDVEMNELLMNVTIDPTYSHAVEEHPEDVEIVRTCLAQKGAYMQFQIEPKKRYLRVCVIDEVNGLIGFQIVDIVGRVAKERTAYVKDSIRNIRQLLDYAKRMGYPRFKGPL